MNSPGQGLPTFPGQVPIWAPGREPLPPGFTEEDREQLAQMKKWEGYMSMGGESCITKTVLAGTLGLGMGAFFSLMSASFQYEDPVLRAQSSLSTTQKTSAVFREMGKNMWSSGKGFGKVGALFAGIECVIESYRAKNDVTNSVTAGFLAGGLLARNAGPKAAFGGGLAFAGFSAAIDLLFLRRETPEED